MTNRIAAGLILILSCLSAHAATLNAVDRGFYDISGLHTPTFLQYFVGDNPGDTSEYRNFFVFDLTSVSGPIVSASLHLPTATSFSVDPSETYGIFDVGTAVASLTAGTGGVAAFSDLGTGTQLGSVIVTGVPVPLEVYYQLGGTFVDVVFNAAGLAYLNAHLGGLTAVGGALTTLNAVNTSNDTDLEYLFAQSAPPFGTFTPQLILNAVPIPAAAWLFGGALGLLGVVRRRSV